jgi:hypothetical protein
MKLKISLMTLLSCIILTISTIHSAQSPQNHPLEEYQKYYLTIAASIQKQHITDEFSYFNTQPKSYLLSLGQKTKKPTPLAPLAQFPIYDTIRNNNISN